MQPGPHPPGNEPRQPPPGVAMHLALVHAIRPHCPELRQAILHRFKGGAIQQHLATRPCIADHCVAHSSRGMGWACTVRMVVRVCA
jgi:hypothetical protein